MVSDHGRGAPALLFFQPCFTIASHASFFSMLPRLLQTEQMTGVTLLLLYSLQNSQLQESVWAAPCDEKKWDNATIREKLKRNRFKIIAKKDFGINYDGFLHFCFCSRGTAKWLIDGGKSRRRRHTKLWASLARD